MKNNILIIIFKSIGFTFLAIAISYFVIGKLLVYVFGDPPELQII